VKETPTISNMADKITGYRDLTKEEIDAINGVKDIGAKLDKLISFMRSVPEFDQRWVSIAETHLQQGIMAGVRAIARPTGF